MKRFISLFVIAAATVLAQSAPSFTVLQGTAPASSRPCSGTQNVGSIYTQITNPSVTSICQQTGSNSLGAGAYGWVSAASGSGASSSYVTLTGTQTLTNKTLTTPVISSISNTGTATVPTTTGGIPVVIDCGATSGSANCGNTNISATGRVYMGKATLAANTAVITFPTAFTSTSTYQCVADDVTTRANPVQMVQTSASTATITNTTGATDAIQWICVGY